MKKLKKSLAIFITLAFVLATTLSSASMVFAEPGGEGEGDGEPVRLTYTIYWDDNNNADGMRPDEVQVGVADGKDIGHCIFIEEYEPDAYEIEAQGNTWVWTSDKVPYTFFKPDYPEDTEDPLSYLRNHVTLHFYTGPHMLDRCPPGYFEPSIPEVRIENGEINYSVVLRHTSGPPSFEVAVPPSQTEFVYNGGAHSPTGGNGWYFPYAAYHRSNAVEWDVGKYTTTIKPLKGYVWNDGTTEPKTINWEIKAAEAPIEVTAPTGQTLTYNGKAQTGVAAGEGYILTETTSATNAGSYQAKATLKEGFVWSDGKTEPKTISWKIDKAIVNVTAPTGKTFTYNGKAQTGVAAGSGYSLSGTVKAINAGSYTAKATLKSDDNYTYKWSDETTAAKTIKWTINKAANPLTIKARTTTVKYSAIKKKAQTLTVGKVITFTKKGQGKMTYTKVSGNKKIVINKTTGKVTVKKGLKKGTYKVKVKIKAAGNANYKASAWKTVTFKVKVK